MFDCWGIVITFWKLFHIDPKKPRPIVLAISDKPFAKHALHAISIGSCKLYSASLLNQLPPFQKLSGFNVRARLLPSGIRYSTVYCTKGNSIARPAQKIVFITEQWTMCNTFISGLARLNACTLCSHTYVIRIRIET